MKSVWIVTYLDNSDRKIVRVVAETSEEASDRLLLRIPHAIIKTVHLAQPSDRIKPLE